MSATAAAGSESAAAAAMVVPDGLASPFGLQLTIRSAKGRSPLPQSRRPPPSRDRLRVRRGGDAGGARRLGEKGVGQAWHASVFRINCCSYYWHRLSLSLLPRVKQAFLELVWDFIFAREKIK